MKKLPAIVVCVSIIFVSLPSAAQSAKEKCLKVAQTNLAACQQKLPPNLSPKDPKNPTESEKAAMSKYSKASTECNTKGSQEALACK